MSFLTSSSHGPSRSSASKVIGTALVILLLSVLPTLAGEATTPDPSTPHDTEQLSEAAAAQTLALKLQELPASELPAPASTVESSTFLGSLAFLSTGSSLTQMGPKLLSFGCQTDGICNFECGSPYDQDCASLACREPNVCGITGGTCALDEQCWVNVCVCMGPTSN